MNVAIFGFFYVGTALYFASALFSIRYLGSAEPRQVRLAVRTLGAGVACYASVFLLRWGAWRHVPLTTMTDALCLFALLSAGLALYVVTAHKVPALLAFYLPPLALVCAVNALVAHRYLPIEPRELRGVPLGIHVGLVFLAYACFFVASMTAAAYLCLASHLKHHRTTWLTQHLPPLAELERTLWRLLTYGYPLFAGTLLLGLVWAWADRKLLGAHWWLSPKVLLTWVMVAFYAVTFHLRRAGRLRGPKLAYLVFLGFMALLGMYVLLSLLGLRGYHFWGAAP